MYCVIILLSCSLGCVCCYRNVTSPLTKCRRCPRVCVCNKQENSAFQLVSHLRKTDSDYHFFFYKNDYNMYIIVPTSFMTNTYILLINQSYLHIYKLKILYFIKKKWRITHEPILKIWKSTSNANYCHTNEVRWGNRIAWVVLITWKAKTTTLPKLFLNPIDKS